MITYEAYTNIEANDILINTRSIAANPYKLFVAQVLYAVFDYMSDEDDNSSHPPIQNIWYSTIPTVDFKSIMEDCINDFTEAVNNKLRLDIADKSYTIRNAESIDLNLLKHSFNFQLKGDNYIIVPEGIKDVKKPVLTADTIHANRQFAMKIWYHGNSSDEGWQDLTEMEVAVYFWLRYIRRNNGVPDIKDVLKVWFDKYHKSFFVSFQDIVKCLQDTEGKAKTAFSFSAEKVQEFNIAHKEHTFLDNVDPDKAADYWYDTLNL